MARWKLQTSHYLDVGSDEKWEYIETNRVTGRPIRTQFNVPRLMDINDPVCWTNNWGTKDFPEGEIVVCHEGKGEGRDIIFYGDPTPDMLPLDDEARALSASFEKHWSYKPVEDSTGFSQSLVDKFQVAMGDIKEKPAEIPGLADLVAQIGKLADATAKATESNRRV